MVIVNARRLRSLTPQGVPFLLHWSARAGTRSFQSRATGGAFTSESAHRRGVQGELSATEKWQPICHHIKPPFSSELLQIKVSSQDVGRDRHSPAQFHTTPEPQESHTQTDGDPGSRGHCHTGKRDCSESEFGQQEHSEGLGINPRQAAIGKPHEWMGMLAQINSIQPASWRLVKDKEFIPSLTDVDSLARSCNRGHSQCASE